MDRKALAWIKGPTNQHKPKNKVVIHHPGEITTIKTQYRWNGGLKHAKGRPPGLPQAGQPITPLSQGQATVNHLKEQIKATVQRSAATWQDP